MPEQSLLSDEMIKLFVEKRPDSYEAFAAMIPIEIREKIDPDQAKSYLGTVLSLCEEYK